MISNLTAQATPTAYPNHVGLFGVVDGVIAEIKNLRLENVNVTGGDGSKHVGGLAGRNFGSITNSYATGSVSGDNTVGGFVGRNDNGIITNSFAAGNSSGNYHVGGFAGHNYYATITDCYAMGSVYGSIHVGGLVGHSRNGTISNCSAMGRAIGHSYAQGFVGWYISTTNNCFWNSEINPPLTYGGEGIIGKTTFEIRIQISNFLRSTWQLFGTVPDCNITITHERAIDRMVCWSATRRRCPESFIGLNFSDNLRG